MVGLTYHTWRLGARRARDNGQKGPPRDPKKGLGHLERGKSRSFEDSWRKARDRRRRESIPYSDGRVHPYNE